MYLNQKAVWNPVVDPRINDYGDIIVSPTSSVIDVRRQEHVEEVRLNDGTIHKTNFVYYTRADVKVDDRLDGFLVVNTYDMRTLCGNNRLRRVYTI